MGTAESRRLDVEQRVTCFYHRFLTLFLNDKPTPQDKALCMRSTVEESLVTQKNLFTILKNLKWFSGVDIIKTHFMAQCMNPAAKIQATQPEQQQPFLLEATPLLGI